jgi:hypothetical protein
MGLCPVAGRAQVVRRASRGRQESVSVADDEVCAIALAQASGGDVLQDHLRELERRVQPAIVDQAFGS